MERSEEEHIIDRYLADGRIAILITQDGSKFNLTTNIKDEEQVKFILDSYINAD